MNNIEIFDNAFQTLVLFVMMVISAVSGLKHSSRKLVVLTCAYASFMLGTLFYMLHLTIIGDIPRIFYVSEISWMAGYLFCLFLATLRTEREQIVFQPVPAMITVLIAGAAVYSEVMGNSVFMSLAFGITAGMTVYISLLKIRKTCCGGAASAAFDFMTVAVVILQILVYFVSEFVSDYSTFNLYYAADILFTLSLSSLFPLLRREVRNR